MKGNPLFTDFRTGQGGRESAEEEEWGGERTWCACIQLKQHIFQPFGHVASVEPEYLRRGTCTEHRSHGAWLWWAPSFCKKAWWLTCLLYATVSSSAEWDKDMVMSSLYFTLELSRKGNWENKVLENLRAMARVPVTKYWHKTNSSPHVSGPTLGPLHCAGIPLTSNVKACRRV